MPAERSAARLVPGSITEPPMFSQQAARASSWQGPTSHNFGESPQSTEIGSVAGTAGCERRSNGGDSGARCGSTPGACTTAGHGAAGVAFEIQRKSSHIRIEMIAPMTAIAPTSTIDRRSNFRSLGCPTALEGQECWEERCPGWGADATPPGCWLEPAACAVSRHQ